MGAIGNRGDGFWPLPEMAEARELNEQSSSSVDAALVTVL
jgi:hypothetical protein